jgi:hypothetical protein
MGKIPQEIQEGIKRLAEINKIPPQTIVERIKELMTTDETVKTMEKEDFKIRYIWSKVYGEYTMVSKATDCYLMPISHPRVREVTMKGEKVFVGDVSGLVQRLEKDQEGNIIGYSESIYASGTFWREGAKNAQKLVPGKVYKTAIVMKDNKWGTTISSDRANFTEVSDHPIPPLTQFYNEKIKPKNVHITIAEMDLNKNENTTDIRTITVTVTESAIGEKEGREYGRYVVMDESIYGSNFTIWAHPKDIVWSMGSVLIFGGTVDVDAKTSKTTFAYQFIIPTDLAEPMKLTPKPAKRQDEVDIGMDMDIDLGTKEVKKEQPKQTTKQEEVTFEV